MNDLDLMLRADGEDATGGDPAGASPADRAKVEGIQEVGHLVRGHLELSADDAEDRLAGLWTLVERRLDADARAEEPAKAPVVAERPGVWARLGSWFGNYRSQLLTGAATAGAVAAIFLVLRPTHETIKTVYQPGPGSVTAPGPGPTIMVKATPAEVESLDVSGGTSTVFTIEADGDDDGETTVIWVTPDDVLEDL